MKIALIGATGFVGSALLKEPLSRGHQVTAIVRNPDKIEKTPHVTATKRSTSTTARRWPRRIAEPTS